MQAGTETEVCFSKITTNTAEKPFILVEKKKIIMCVSKFAR